MYVDLPPLALKVYFYILSMRIYIFMLFDIFPQNMGPNVNFIFRYLALIP